MTFASSDQSLAANWLFMFLTMVPLWMIVGNCLVMVAVARNRNLQNLLNTVIASLALTDFLLAVIVVPCGIIQLVCGRWVLGFYACLAWTGSDVILSTSSIMHLCAIAIHRYRGIAFPLHTRSASGRQVAALIVPAWFVAVALSVPFIVQATLHQSYVLQNIPNPDNISQIEEENYWPYFLQTANQQKTVSVNRSNDKNFLFEKRNSSIAGHSEVQKSIRSFQSLTESEDHMLCGIFNHVFAIYSSLVSFFIPLAVMVFADIGSIRTLRRNALSKLKNPLKFPAKRPTKKFHFCKNLLSLDSGTSPNDAISPENISVSTLTSPLTPTLSSNQSPAHGFSKQSLFFTDSSSLSLSFEEARSKKICFLSRKSNKAEMHQRAKNQHGQFIRGATKLRRHNSRHSTQNIFFRRTKTKINDNLMFNDTSFCPQSVDKHKSSRSSQSTENNQELSNYQKKKSNYRAEKLNFFQSSSKSFSESVKTCKTENFMPQSKKKDDEDHDSSLPESLVCRDGRSFRPRTRSLLRMEILSSRSSQARGREKRAEKTLIWVFLVFVALWLPFFCTNLTYGICGGENLQEQQTSNNQSYLHLSLSTGNLLTEKIDDASSTKSLCHIPSEFFTVFTWLGYLSSGVNPCIYTLLNKDFRQAFKNTIMCKRKSSTHSRPSKATPENDILD